MNWTKITVFGLLVVFIATVAAPQTTYADCSFNGYYHSNGKCGKSWKEDRDDKKDNFYQNRQLMLERYIEQLMQLLERLKEQQGNYDDNNSDVDVYTRSATSIEDTEADLRGELDLNGEDEAEVYFEYGTSRYDLDETSSKKTLDNDGNFTINIDDLDEDTLYYFRAVAEDENGDEDYGSILSFRTDGNGNDEEPIVDTRSANNVGDDYAVLRGTVDMNDFSNGEVFFVYGEDESQINDAEDDFDSYSDVDEDGEDLQKVMVDNDLDGYAAYSRTVSGLDNDTDIFFRICVGYENEDNDDTLMCGDTEEFTTDN